MKTKFIAIGFGLCAVALLVMGAAGPLYIRSNSGVGTDTTLNGTTVVEGMANGQTLWMDSIVGVDSNSGTNPWAPIKTLTNLARTKFSSTVQTVHLSPGTYTLEGLAAPISDAFFQFSNLVIFANGATLDIRRSGAAAAVRPFRVGGVFEFYDGAIICPTNLVSTTMPIWVNTNMVRFRFDNTLFGGQNDAFYQDHAGAAVFADRTNAIYGEFNSCTFTSRYDGMFLGALGFTNYQGSNFWKFNGGAFEIAPDHIAFITISNTTGANCFRSIDNWPGTYVFTGTHFDIHNGGPFGTYGIRLNGSNQVAHIAGCTFDLTSTNGPAWWFSVTNNATVHWYGPPLPEENYCAIGGNVVWHASTNYVGTFTTPLGHNLNPTNTPTDGQVLSATGADSAWAAAGAALDSSLFVGSTNGVIFIDHATGSLKYTNILTGDWYLWPTNQPVSGVSNILVLTDNQLSFAEQNQASGGGGGGDSLTNSGPITLSIVGGAVAINATTPLGCVTNAIIPYRLTLTEDVTLSAPTGGLDGQRITIEFIQDGTGGWTVTPDGDYAFGSDITGLSLSVPSGSVDFATFIYNNIVGEWRCVGFVRGF